MMPLATTTAAPTGVAIPTNPCASYGCPSLNNACPAGTTGPAGVSASGCTYSYISTTVNLNLDVAASTLTLDSVLSGALNVAIVNLGIENMGYDYACFPVSTTAVGTNMLAVTGYVVCSSCTAATLQSIADSLMGFMPPYAFGNMNLPINSIASCMTTSAVNGVCQNNINAVVGNPPAPCTDNCGSSGGVSMGVIIGAVAGGIVGIIAIVAGVYLYRKRANSFSTATRNISSSNAQPAHTVSGPVLTTGAYNGGNNFNNNGNFGNPSPRMGAQQPTNMQMGNMNMAAPAPPMRNFNNGSPRGPQAMGGGYGQGYNNQQRF